MRNEFQPASQTNRFGLHTVSTTRTESVDVQEEGKDSGIKKKRWVSEGVGGKKASCAQHHLPGKKKSMATVDSIGSLKSLKKEAELSCSLVPR